MIVGDIIFSATEAVLFGFALLAMWRLLQIIESAWGKAGVVGAALAFLGLFALIMYSTWWGGA